MLSFGCRRAGDERHTNTQHAASDPVAMDAAGADIMGRYASGALQDCGDNLHPLHQSHQVPHTRSTCSVGTGARRVADHAHVPVGEGLRQHVRLPRHSLPNAAAGRGKDCVAVHRAVL